MVANIEEVLSREKKIGRENHHRSSQELPLAIAVAEGEVVAQDLDKDIAKDKKAKEESSVLPAVSEAAVQQGQNNRSGVELVEALLRRQSTIKVAGIEKSIKLQMPGAGDFFPDQPFLSSPLLFSFQPSSEESKKMREEQQRNLDKIQTSLDSSVSQAKKEMDQISARFSGRVTTLSERSLAHLSLASGNATIKRNFF